MDTTNHCPICEANAKHIKRLEAENKELKKLVPFKDRVLRLGIHSAIKTWEILEDAERELKACETQATEGE